MYSFFLLIIVINDSHRGHACDHLVDGARVVMIRMQNVCNSNHDNNQRKKKKKQHIILNTFIDYL